MKNVREALEGTDWQLLSEQKEALADGFPVVFKTEESDDA